MPSTGIAPVLTPALAFAIGAGYFVATFGIEPLLPRNLDWLIADDKAQHLTGWLYFNREPWRWPIGRIESILPPIGTSIVLTDSIPLLAILTKLIAGGEPVQYFGLWFAVCFGLQGLVGALLVRLVTPNPLVQLLGAAYFVLSPVLLFRTLHAALCAHWLILLAIWLIVRSVVLKQPVGWLPWSLLIGLAVTIHPYLAAMVGALALADLVSHVRCPVEIFGLARLAAIPVLIAGLFGLGGSPGGAAGFSSYTADLLTFINPMGFNIGYESWLPSYPTGRYQYEGYGYLGLGTAVLALAAAWGIVRSRPRVPFRPFVPLGAACLAMLLFALSPRVTAAGMLLVESQEALRLLEPVGALFRSSGRFVWPAYYLVVTGIVLLIGRLLPGWLAVLGLVAGLSFQLADLQPLRYETRIRLAWTYQTELRSPEWHRLGERYRHLALVPPVVPGAECRQNDEDWQQLLLMMTIAARQGLTINSAYLARAPLDRAQALCEKFMSAVERGTVQADTVYVVSPRLEADFRRWTAGRTVCRAIDEFLLCESTVNR